MYWIVSVPYERNKQETINHLKKDLISQNLTSECNEFQVPSKMKHGTIDELLILSENLVKYDSQCENTTARVLRFLSELSSSINTGKNDVWVPEINVSEDRVQRVQVYLNTFQWDDGQYMLSKSIKDLSESIHKKIINYEEEFREKSQKFSSLCNNIDSLKRKSEGSLVVKPLDGIIKEEHIIDTEYLATVFVVVPKNNESEWTKHYDEDFLDEAYVVPDSSLKIDSDSESILFRAVVLKKFKDDFELACQKRRFIVRKFEYDPERALLAKMETDSLIDSREELKRDNYLWCKMCFSECFSAWIHIKAIRVYVESVLRYGVPPQFSSLIIKVPKGKQSKLLKYFKSHYKYLEEEDIQGFHDISNYGMELLPYVILTLNTDELPQLRL